MIPYILLFINIFLSVAGQYFLKFGVTSLTYKFSLVNLPKILFSPYVFLGFALYGVSSILWIYILKNIPLSVAYPTLSLGYVLVLFLSARLLNENITLANYLGVFLIIVGVRLLFIK